MKLSIYLHKDIADRLKCFGKLNDVVNSILKECESGNIDWYNKPLCPPREGAARYNIEITNLAYLKELTQYPINSPVISLRRLLYWFVENEVFNDLGWIQLHEYVDSNTKYLEKSVSNAVNALQRLYLVDADSDRQQAIADIIDNIGELYGRK